MTNSDAVVGFVQDTSFSVDRGYFAEAFTVDVWTPTVGATLVYTEGRYHILPVNEAIRGHLVPRLSGSSEVYGYEVRAVPLKYISASEMAKILEPYVRENAIVSVDILRHMIFLAGTGEELENYLQTIEIFDEVLGNVDDNG